MPRKRRIPVPLIKGFEPYLTLAEEIKEFERYLTPAERSVHSTLARISHRQGKLKQIIASSQGYPQSDAVYARILTQEESIGNLFNLQRVIRFRPRAIEFDRPFRRDLGTGGGPTGFTGFMSSAMTPEHINELIEAYESAPFGFREKIKATVAKARPSLRMDWRKPFSTWKGKPITVVHEPNSFAQYILKRVEETIRKKKQAIVVLGGLRGAGKTTSINELKSGLEAQGINVTEIEMDSYFKEPDECKAHGTWKYGGWDNPRNSNIGQLAKAIQDFRRGKKITMPVGRVPRHGVIQTREIDPAKTNVLLVEGIHALEPQVAKQADIRGFFYIPPGLQEIRTVLGDIIEGGRKTRPELIEKPKLKEKAKEMGPEYYTGINIRVRPWHKAFILPRIIDTEILFEQKWSPSDIEALARLLKLDEERKRELAQAWGVELAS